MKVDTKRDGVTVEEARDGVRPKQMICCRTGSSGNKMGTKIKSTIQKVFQNCT